MDEAGRGPLAGPVTVAAVAFLVPFEYALFKDVRDSKKLSAKKREYFEGLVRELEKQGMVRACMHSSPEGYIDQHGIVRATQSALEKALVRLNLPPEQCHVYLDGSLKAPAVFEKQETIIKGDETVLPITLAGIMAKTTRDAYMHTVSKQYPAYSFETHKGYGTKKHYEALEQHGMCPLHRRTFIDLTKHIK